MWARIGAIAGLTVLSAGIGVAIYAGWTLSAASASATPSTATPSTPASTPTTTTKGG